MSTNEEIISNLLVEFKQHRDAVMQMITDIEILKDKIDKLIPDSLDSRYVRFFEEKVKTVTEFFKALLDMRKEINKSLRDEIDIRRKVEGKDAEVDLEALLDVRQATRKIENFKNDVSKMKESMGVEKAVTLDNKDFIANFLNTFLSKNTK